MTNCEHRSPGAGCTDKNSPNGPCGVCRQIHWLLVNAADSIEAAINLGATEKEIRTTRDLVATGKLER